MKHLIIYKVKDMPLQVELTDLDLTENNEAFHYLSRKLIVKANYALLYGKTLRFIFVI